MEKKFNELLREARVNAGYTQSQIAEIVGVAKSTYCNWEQGTREPNIIKLKVLAQALGVSCDYLIGIEEPDFFLAAQNRYGKERIRAYIEALSKIR